MLGESRKFFLETKAFRFGSRRAARGAITTAPAQLELQELGSSKRVYRSEHAPSVFLDARTRYSRNAPFFQRASLSPSLLACCTLLLYLLLPKHKAAAALFNQNSKRDDRKLVQAEPHNVFPLFRAEFYQSLFLMPAAFAH